MVAPGDGFAGGGVRWFKKKKKKKSSLMFRTPIFVFEIFFYFFFQVTNLFVFLGGSFRAAAKRPLEWGSLGSRHCVRGVGGCVRGVGECV